MFKVFECNNCKTQVMSFTDDKLTCCMQDMVELVPNSVDASFEKHVPTYEIVDGIVKAKVNHVMEEEHYIEYLAYIVNNEQDVRYFEPYMDIEAEFKYVEGGKLYAYCNKHGLWMCQVK